MGWTSVAEWDRLKAGVGCPMCADIHLDENAFSYKVAEFEHTYVRLPKNDVAHVAQALDHVYHPAKINYSVFGNLCPHVHCHLILQTFADDPHAPVNMHAQVVLLAPDEYRAAIQALQQALG